VREAVVIETAAEFLIVFDETARLASRASAAKADFEGGGPEAQRISLLEDRLARAHTRLQLLCRASLLPVVDEARAMADDVFALVMKRRPRPSAGYEQQTEAMSSHRNALLDALREETGSDRVASAAPGGQ
jgi:hypothetical protein